ncbi:MAG: MBL fold metallo-hydrolase [Candidatus Omnitrophica bacterium]|jgi:ribonuclease BN (tRNA processing enzyme)|nr:MBL fold metallo-hydrolase [Candidatus Omnitrophota bacterium]
MSYIKFLGTAGARFVMIRQLRSSAGIWFSYKSTNVFIDPGPGALVRCSVSKPKLDPANLDAIILTHKHLDHAGDINAMIEAMTEGGFKKRGVLFLPQDALGENGVVFSYLKDFPEKKVILKKGNFSVGDIRFEVPVQNLHPVETYGLKFKAGDEVISLVADTDYFEDLIDAYKDSTTLILNVVFYQKRDDIQHLCLEEALEIIKKIKPKRAIITHFGMTILQAKPHTLEEKIRESLKMDITFAYDGMKVEI